jgi:hypothetical protein
MVKIQLLENPVGEVVAIEGTAVPLTFSISDIKDPSTKKGAFSKTIQIAGTADVKALFGAVFHINYATGAFNRFRKTPCVLYQDDIPLINGTLKLVNITRTANTSPEGIDSIIFDVIVSDNTASLFQKIGDKLLVDNPLTSEDVEKGLSRSPFDIDLAFINDTNPVLSYTAIVGSTANTVADGFKYVWCQPSPGAGSLQYSIADFKPAIYTKVYFDQIFANAGFTYEWDVESGPTAQDSRTTFEKLLTPFTDSNLPSYIDAITARVGRVTEFGVTASGSGVESFRFQDQIIQNVELFDGLNAFNTTTGEYQSPYPFTTLPNGLECHHKIDFEIILSNPTGSTAIPIFPNTFVAQFTHQPIIVYKLNDSFNSQSTFGSTIYNSPLSINPGATVSLGTGSAEFMNTVNFINTNDLLSFDVGLNTTVDTANVSEIDLVQWSEGFDYDVPVAVEYELKITRIETIIRPNSSYIPNDFPIDMNAYIPKKIKQKDLIKGIFTMFNLYAYSDPLDVSNIIIKQRDAFYDDGVSRDWTSKWIIDQESKISFLSDESNGDIKLTYKFGIDQTNKNYLSAVGEIYGELNYRLLDEELKGETKIELPFEPSPIYKTAFGAFVNSYGGLEKIGLRQLYDGGVRTCDPYTIASTNDVSSAFTEYNYTGHFNDPIDPELDLNFGPCDFYYGLDLISFTLTNNNLFSNYWRRSIGQIDTGKKLTAYFNLTPADVNKLRLSDKIFIQDAWYNILSIRDYDANTKRPTLVELVTIDDATQLPRVPIKSSAITNPGTNVFDGVALPGNGNNLVSTLDKPLINGTWNIVNSGGGKSIILGNSNRVSGSGNIVLGNNKTIQEGVNNTVFADRIIVNDQTIGGLFNENYIPINSTVNEFTFQMGAVDLNTTVLYTQPLPDLLDAENNLGLPGFTGGFMDPNQRIVSVDAIIYMNPGAIVGLTESRARPVTEGATIKIIDGVSLSGNVYIDVDPLGPFATDARFGGTAGNRGYVTIKYINE